MAAKKKTSAGDGKAAGGAARPRQAVRTTQRATRRATQTVRPSQGARREGPSSNGSAKASKGSAGHLARSAARLESHTNGTGLWNLRLYVAGQTPKSITAFSNLKRICEEHLSGRYTIEVIDLMENPHLAVNDQIVAVPTLVRKLPEPLKKVIGDLSNTEKALVGLDLRQAL